MMNCYSFFLFSSAESKSVPTSFHFALLLVEECRVKQYLDAVRRLVDKN